jgi:MATE family multidrug resistance protein
MVANLTTPLIGVVSTIAIGRLGDATLLGGVAITSVVFDCLFWLFSFLRTSTVAFTAQALGAGETQEIRALLVRGLVIAALVGLALIVLQIPLGLILLDAMGGSEGVTKAARAYFAIRIWSAPIVLANFVVLGWLIGQARAGLALAIQIVINFINMAATVALVIGMDAGIEGAAVAAVVAEAAGLVLGVAVARTITHRPHRSADRRAVVLHCARRACRGCGPRRQRGAEQFSPDQRVFPRWPRQRRPATLRTGLWRA